MKKPQIAVRRPAGRKRATDEEVAAAVIAAGGNIGVAARALGKTSHAIRKRTTLTVPNPELRGLPARVRQEMRAVYAERDRFRAALCEIVRKLNAECYSNDDGVDPVDILDIAKQALGEDAP